MANTQSIHRGDLLVQGTLSATTFSPPAASIGNAAIKSDAAIDASKLEHQHSLTYRQDDGSDIVAAIVPIHTVRGVSGVIIDVEVTCIDAPDGGDKAFSVDLKKCSQASPSPASVLSAVVDFTASEADCEVVTGTVTTTALLDGDTLVVVVAVSGSSGNQGQGLLVTATIREDAE